MMASYGFTQDLYPDDLNACYGRVVAVRIPETMAPGGAGKGGA